nr:uncharacterized protein LOC113460127 [Zonotrichia albicollis]
MSPVLRWLQNCVLPHPTAVRKTLRDETEERPFQALHLALPGQQHLTWALQAAWWAQFHHAPAHGGAGPVQHLPQACEISVPISNGGRGCAQDSCFCIPDFPSHRGRVAWSTGPGYVTYLCQVGAGCKLQSDLETQKQRKETIMFLSKKIVYIRALIQGTNIHL